MLKAATMNQIVLLFVALVFVVAAAAAAAAVVIIIVAMVAVVIIITIVASTHSLTVRYYCLYVNYIIAPCICINTLSHICGSFAFLFFVHIIRSHKVTLYDAHNGITSAIKWVCMLAFKCDSMIRLLCLILLCLIRI